MFVRSLARASTLFCTVAGALLAVLAPAAQAGPPVITGNAITAQIPNIGETVTVNLRELGVIRGSAPLVVDGSSLQILVNGQPSGTLNANLFPNNGPGRVCIVFSNSDFVPSPGLTFGLQLAVTDLAGNRVASTVTITDTPGSVVDTPAEQAACDDRNTTPVANAGPDQTLNDTDAQPTETVQLDGSGSSDPDPDNVLTYQWFDVDNDQQLGPPSASPLLTVTLGPGTHNLSLSVNDDSSDTATSFANDEVVITINGPVAPIPNAGPDQTLNDSDAQAGENVTLNGSGSSDPDGTIATYEWFRVIDPDTSESLGTGQTLTVRLPDGVNDVRLSVTDNAGNIATDSVVITVNALALPTANAGPDQTVADSDGQPGESISLDGSASTDADGTIATYEWVRVIDPNTNEALGNGQTLTVRLPDGTNDVRLTVTDNAGNVATDAVIVTVGAPAIFPTANAGPDQNVDDSNGQPGESVTLDGSASTDTDGTIASYEWARLVGDVSEALGTGATLTVTLPDGTNNVRLTVTDNAGNASSDFVVITVEEPAEATILSDIPGLTPNQLRMAQKLDSMCDSLTQLSGAGTLTDDQADLLAKCNGIRINNTTANQIGALEELIPDDFAVARTQTLLFANTQYVSVMDRLMALRGGAKGLSLAGLNIIVDGKMVPLAQLEEMVHQFFGGGASADEPGGLLSDKWGLWARGNFSFGEKEQSAASPAFDADQWAFVGGIDYRLSDSAVLGAALSYGSSSIDFAADEGALDTESFSVSLYGSAYAAKNFYFDGILNFANSSYDANRNIAYTDGSGLVTADAEGNTDGTTLSGGLSAGYDFLAGGLTISPNLGFFYIDTSIDEFTETGAGGLNLIYDEQQFKSLTGNAGLRLTYAWNVSWGVMLPHVRVDYVREFEDDVDVFGVRFAADPNAASAPPVLVATDNPDQSYWRLAAGFSAQFKYGVSGYIEYQRLESFEFIDFQDVSIGLRFQRSF